MFWKRLMALLQRRAAQAVTEQARLDAACLEYDRLRAELSHLEHEIYEIWELDLPRSQKAILESAIRVRARALEDRIWDLSLSMWRSRATDIA